MSTEYIERGALINEIEKHFETIGANAQRLVARFPAAAVAPVVHGALRINNQGFLECSACGAALRMPLISTSEMKRCYLCGAIFEKRDDDESY